MADMNPGAQYMNWEQYGGPGSAFGEAGSNFKKWLAAGVAQKSGLVDALDSMGASVPKSLQPIAPPTLQSVAPNSQAVIPNIPASSNLPAIDPMSIPAVGQIQSLGDKTQDFLKMIWGGNK